METEHYLLTADIHDGLSCTVLLSLGLRLFPGDLAFNHTSQFDNHNRQRHSLWGPVTWPCLLNFSGVIILKKNHWNTVMFCAVKVIDREGRDTVRFFNTHLTFTRDKVRSLRSFSVIFGHFGQVRSLRNCGVVNPQSTIRGPDKLLLNFVV